MINDIKIIDFYFNFLIFLGVFKSKNCKTLFDTYSSIIYRIFMRIFPHLLLGWQIARLLFNPLTFEEFMETSMFIIAVCNAVIKGIIIMIKQSQIEMLKIHIDSFLAGIQSNKEKDTHKRSNNFMRFRYIYELSS